MRTAPATPLIGSGGQIVLCWRWTRQRPTADLNSRGETEQRRYTAFARAGRYSGFHDQQLFDVEPAWGALALSTIDLSGFPAVDLAKGAAGFLLHDF
jgi:hypothetical protein